MILGTSVGSEDIILYAKKKGIHTTVVDYLSMDKSRAKLISDEHANISTTDIDSLVSYARANNINAVFAGVSEINIESARKVSECLGLKTLYTESQWKKFMNKDNFRKLCVQYDVPTPITYYMGAYERESFIQPDDMIFPVIVKPVDSCANIGISICYNIDQIDKACILAAEKSYEKQIIIEQLIDGIEISSTYVVQNGICELVCYGDKYAYKTDNGLSALSNVYVYPGANLEAYLSAVDYSIKKMINGEGLDNCTIFFQGIYRKNKFYIFEAGLRMEGTASYRMVDKLEHQNFMNFLVDVVLQEPTRYKVSNNDASFGGKKCVKYTMISTGGILTKIEGFDSLCDENIIFKEQRHQIGDKIVADGTLHQILFRFDILAEKTDVVVNTIKKIQTEVKAYDDCGRNMIISGFDPEFLLKI